MFDMIDISTRMDGERLVVELDPNEPIALDELSGSFSALSRIYDRHYAESSGARLYLTRIQTGSVIAEVAPYAMIMGGIAFMDASLVVAEFSRRLGDGLKAFAGTLPADTQTFKRPLVTPEDAADLKEFVRPMLGKYGATLNIKRAHFLAETADRRVEIDYEFGEGELNRAALNIDRFIELPASKPDAGTDEYDPFERKLLLVESASRARGRESGRTADKGVVPDFSPDAFPLHFAKSINDLKGRMMRSSVNPLADYAFIVSGYRVHRAGSTRSYLVTELNDVVEGEA